MFRKLALVASLVLIGTSCAWAQSGDKIVIKVGYGTAGGPIHEGALELKKRLESANSHIQVQVFPGGQLGSEGEIIGQLQAGMTDMLLTTTGPLGQQNPVYYVLETPYVFLNDAQADKVLDGPVGAKLLKGMFEQKVEPIDVMLFSRQLYTLLKAGVPILRALAGVDDQSGDEGRAAGCPREPAGRSRVVGLAGASPQSIHAVLYCHGARRRNDRPARCHLSAPIRAP